MSQEKQKEESKKAPNAGYSTKNMTIAIIATAVLSFGVGFLVFDGKRGGIMERFLGGNTKNLTEQRQNVREYMYDMKNKGAVPGGGLNGGAMKEVSCNQGGPQRFRDLPTQ